MTAHPSPERTDYLWAGIVFLLALGVYLRTMAPDLLYGDSAEMQTLAHTPGIAHSPGYPIYLLVAHNIGQLPINNFAWRVNFFSVVSGALSVATVFLLTRYLTFARGGAFISAFTIMLSYTLWHQSLIAEVYAPAVALLGVMMILLLQWYRQGDPRKLGAVGFLLGISPGCHFFVMLFAPGVLGFIVIRLRGASWKLLLPFIGGGLLGISLFFASLWWLVAQNTGSNHYSAVILPSRSVWNVSQPDLDTPAERMLFTLSIKEFRDQTFSSNVYDSIKAFFVDYWEREWMFTVLVLACLGFIVWIKREPELGWFGLGTWLLILLVVASYDIPDQDTLYLPAFILMSAAAGGGVGFLIERIPATHNYWRWSILLLSGIAICWHLLPSRLDALRTGIPQFIDNPYQFPVHDLNEPRRLAETRLALLPGEALVIADWRTLYTMSYVAHIEGKYPNLEFIEVSPLMAKDHLADSLIDTIRNALCQSKPVYIDRLDGNLRPEFEVNFVLGSDLYRLSPRSETCTGIEITRDHSVVHRARLYLR